MEKFTYNQNEKLLTWTLAGRYDTAACGKLSEMILGKIAAMRGTGDPSKLLDGKVVFDFKDVEFVSSSFFRICISVTRQVNKGSLIIINCNHYLVNTFKIAGLGELLSVS
ncbi:MAG: STAS domain-containing protein [Bacteroidetes bacterium]|nr:STAS domain-containing protein [Bacteroidota bacterium]